MVPSKDAVMPQLIKLVSDGKEHCFDEAEQQLAKTFKLSKQDLEERISSGYRTRFRSNVTWAVTALVQQNQLERTSRGCFKMATAAGKATMPIPLQDTSNKLPEETIEDLHRQMNVKLAQEILAEVKNASPLFLESLVLDLLQKMGYGKQVREAGSRVGGTGDGGIDGFVREDQLGFDIIYYQAKRWGSNPVTSKEVREFAGSLDKYHSSKGVFITTSQFSSDARQFVQNLPKKIILVDGERLGQLMIEHGVGVTVAKNYEVKETDTDYFNERK